METMHARDALTGSSQELLRRHYTAPGMLGASMPLLANHRPRSPVTEARYKQRAGRPLTPEERDLAAAYFREYERRKKSVHLSREREAEWSSLAQERGMPLSQWIQAMVDKALQKENTALPI